MKGKKFLSKNFLFLISKFMQAASQVFFSSHFVLYDAVSVLISAEVSTYVNYFDLSTMDIL